MKPVQNINKKGGGRREGKVSEPGAKQELSFMTSFVNPKANETLQLTSHEVTKCLTYCSANFTTHTHTPQWRVNVNCIIAYTNNKIKSVAQCE